MPFRHHEQDDGAKITNANPENLDDSNNDVISLIMVQA